MMCAHEVDVGGEGLKWETSGYHQLRFSSSHVFFSDTSSIATGEKFFDDCNGFILGLAKTLRTKPLESAFPTMQIQSQFILPSII